MQKLLEGWLYEEGDYDRKVWPTIKKYLKRKKDMKDFTSKASELRLNLRSQELQKNSIGEHMRQALLYLLTLVDGYSSIPEPAVATVPEGFVKVTRSSDLYGSSPDTIRQFLKKSSLGSDHYILIKTKGGKTLWYFHPEKVFTAMEETASTTRLRNVAQRALVHVRGTHGQK